MRTKKAGGVLGGVARSIGGHVREGTRKASTQVLTNSRKASTLAV